VFRYIYLLYSVCSPFLFASDLPSETLFYVPEVCHLEVPVEDVLGISFLSFCSKRSLSPLFLENSSSVYKSS
jgi:hypothetical protein